MKNRTLGMIVLADLALTLVWLAIVVATQISYPDLDTYEGALAFAREKHWLFYTVSYANAILLTILTVGVYAGLYALLKEDRPVWAATGFAFVPMYGLIATLSYLSQLVLLPRLLALLASPEYEAAARVLLRNLIQVWPDSSLQQFDQFSYALLSIPAIVFGSLLLRKGRLLALAGGLLIASGAACALVGIGVVAGVPALVGGPSMIGGVLSIVAYAPLALGLWRGAPATP